MRGDSEACVGTPEADRTCASHAQRQNTTVRISMRRFTPLTGRFSKKFEGHGYAAALYTLHGNR
jgi:hypothetical protein